MGDLHKHAGSLSGCCRQKIIKAAFSNPLLANRDTIRLYFAFNAIGYITEFQMRVSLVEFFVTEFKTHIFVIDTQKADSAKEPWHTTVAIREKEIQAAKTLIWGFGKSPLIIQQNLEHFQQIGARLLQPVIEYLDLCDILYIVPHKDLHYLPLHAVEINDRALCDRFAVVYLPNASVLRFFYHMYGRNIVIENISQGGISSLYVVAVRYNTHFNTLSADIVA